MEEQNKVELNELAMDSLRVSAKWSTFLAIIGFIGIGFMLLAALMVGSIMSAIPEQPGYGGMNPFDAIKNYLALIYVVIAIIYFFPVFYLFKYASGMKKALNFRNSDMVADALVYLKSHHKFLGIMTIVVISLYIVMLIGVMIFAASMASSFAH